MSAHPYTYRMNRIIIIYYVYSLLLQCSCATRRVRQVLYERRSADRVLQLLHSSAQCNDNIIIIIIKYSSSSGNGVMGVRGVTAIYIAIQDALFLSPTIALVDSYMIYNIYILQCTAHYCLTFYAADTRDKRSLGYNVYYIYIRFIISSLSCVYI